MHERTPGDVDGFMEWVGRRNPHEPEFLQAVEEVAESVVPFLSDHDAYRDARILERLTEPDRMVTFRVNWEDEKGNVRVNRVPSKCQSGHREVSGV